MTIPMHRTHRRGRRGAPPFNQRNLGLDAEDTPRAQLRRPPAKTGGGRGTGPERQKRDEP